MNEWINRNKMGLAVVVIVVGVWLAIHGEEYDLPRQSPICEAPNAAAAQNPKRHEKRSVSSLYRQCDLKCILNA